MLAAEASPCTQTVPELTAIQRIGLTVRDIGASETWYRKVLGLVRALVEPHATGDGHAVVTTRPGTGVFRLEHHPDADRTVFNPLRTGLNHPAVSNVEASPCSSGPHRALVCRWVRDPNPGGRLIAVWIPDPAADDNGRVQPDETTIPPGHRAA